MRTDNSDRADIARGGPALFRLVRFWSRRWAADAARQSTARDGTGQDGTGDVARVGHVLVLEAIDAALASGSAAIGDVAVELGLDRSNASRMLAGAVATGLVTKAVSPDDARRTELAMTSAGRSLLAAARTWQEEAFARLVAGWPAQDARQFAGYLQRLAAQALQPRALQPRALQPRALQPQALQPQALQPQALQPQALQPQALQPQALQPQAPPTSEPPRPGRPQMSIVLNHTIVPVGDRYRAARFLADLLGVGVAPSAGPFVPVPVNDDLTLDFDDRLGARPGHYAFLVDDATFDRALRLALESDLEFGSAPRLSDREINRAGGGRGVYVRDPDGIAYELFTVIP
jgi:DNA-binding MarR family transcriptional regulator/catechol 2,3-dioxygenase-like lactoylglutathione lyase family enzyme